MDHVYVVIKTIPQNKFCDRHGEIATDTKKIIAIVRSEAKALEMVTSLQKNDDELVAKFSCDPSEYHYEKYEVQQ